MFVAWGILVYARVLSLVYTTSKGKISISFVATKNVTMLAFWLVCTPTSTNSLNSPLSLSKESPLLLVRNAETLGWIFNLLTMGVLLGMGLKGPPGLGGTLVFITCCNSISCSWLVNLTMVSSLTWIRSWCMVKSLEIRSCCCPKRSISICLSRKVFSNSTIYNRVGSSLLRLSRVWIIFRLV